ncbi:MULTISPECIES: serine hydrolase domain-containing protein [unclassified Pedobacter]|uniref:serine hydrolase domain-containing protein n=1 Tax=unclassified Pedobacter TaxID=2628915 RepID=UPI00142429ED|nr:MULTISPECIES: serine hydrolase [unclassified Pedobacter]NII85652.1 CubicO group peptidase (beta-lactamase class C family) [Pedobacter sp. SG908]NMN39432.1 CubicO group peptidase (beta-lactamase class C family) [Pedobacter sp. SG918]
MKRNRLYILAAASFFNVLCLMACAQEHTTNEKKLAIANAISNTTVLLNNQDAIIPLKSLEKKNIASVSLSFAYSNVFDSLANKYDKITSFSADSYKDSLNLNDLEDDLKYFNTILISIDDQNVNKAKYINFINSISKNKQVIISFFGNGPGLKSFDLLQSPIIWTAQNNADAAAIVPQYIFGGIAAVNKLSTAFSARYTMGSGFVTTATRLKYTVPEDAGINSNNLKEIDAIASEAITQKATPGLVVLVAKDGKVIFNKAYGTHTYDTNVPDKVTDIFDLASVTKVTATTPAVMRLFEEGKLKLDTNIGAYIPKARTTPMNNIQVREVMLHQAGFIPYIPFHDYIKTGDYSRDSSAAYPTKVADNYYIKKGFFKDFMWPKMLNSPIKTRGKYVYSDISMYVMKDIVEHISEEPLNQYTYENFYKPLGMQTAGFLPRNRFKPEQIIPTEDDKYFRKTLLVGYVHDQGAALAGGVSGHAGLFASANDLAIIYQMLLNRGTYGGVEYFKNSTVDMFTSKQSNVSRRGLGFDRWDPDTTKHYPSELASPQTYGHTGYTGTCVWVDPSRGLVYVFLSNRVNPTVTDKLSNLKIRGRIQDVVNKAIDESKK